ncbi:Heavy metal-associated isoprenylated plant protein 43 [Hirschfeldia incana]|nr:Heavy metal-associated isoprenylated plant protein 43 [Hirschfeldia incana]
MTVKKVEIKVDINCGKCNSAILEAVTVIEGVNHISLDEKKNILTVVGTMDPVCVASRLKKIKQKPVIISVGPPPKPPEPPKPPAAPEPPKPPEVPEPPKPPPPPPGQPKPVCNCKPMSPYCASCDVVSVTTYESGSGCTII